MIFDVATNIRTILLKDQIDSPTIDGGHNWVVRHPVRCRCVSQLWPRHHHPVEWPERTLQHSHQATLGIHEECGMNSGTQIIESNHYGYVSIPDITQVGDVLV